jgi:hypothetical protein
MYELRHSKSKKKVEGGRNSIKRPEQAIRLVREVTMMMLMIS